MRKARESSERLWRGTVSNLAEEERMVRGGLYSVVEKTCKIWRASRAQRFECYCRKFQTDTGVRCKPVLMPKQCSS